MAGRLRLGGALVLLAAVAPVEAQSPPFSSTLRYGSGYFDVPAAAVLPGGGLRAGLSGFRVSVGADPVVDAAGNVTDPGNAESRIHGDAFLALGILGRGELGASFQSFASGGEGGRLIGLFGKLLLLNPAETGLGLAVGGRYLGSPDFGDGVRHAPTRLGFPDSRARRRFADGRELDTRLTLYGVATLRLRGVEASWLPENDVNVSVGYGSGMFREGGELPWYAPPGMDGWFLAGGVDLALGPNTLLTLEAEHTGFDVNVGAEVARGGLRVGVHLLGANHDDETSAYRSRKVGLSLSLTACPLLKRACAPALRSRSPADTVRLPAPPPDTVVVRRVGPAREERNVRPVPLCLATGEDLWVLVTAAGDTLVGPGRRPLASFSPGDGLPGTYAQADSAFRGEAPLRVEGARYLPEGDPFEPSCAGLVPWGRWGDVPVFRLRDAGEVPEVVLLPLRPGVWQRYRRVRP